MSMRWKMQFARIKIKVGIVEPKNQNLAMSKKWQTNMRYYGARLITVSL